MLGALARLVEQQPENALCTVLLMDADGSSLRHEVAPSLPDTYKRAIDGINIGPCAGSIGTAAYLKEPVVVADITCLRELGEHGLREGLEALAEELRVNALISPELTIDVDFAEVLDQGIVANVLQIAREATSNVIRHARAASVKITRRRTGPMLCLTIEDNGRGFDPTGRLPDESGQGLRNMLERARVFGGHLDVASEVGHGTVVTLGIPLSLEHRRPVG